MARATTMGSGVAHRTLSTGARRTSTHAERSTGLVDTLSRA
jgi:hypothetical protein